MSRPKVAGNATFGHSSARNSVNAGCGEMTAVELEFFGSCLLTLARIENYEANL